MEVQGGSAPDGSSHVAVAVPPSWPPYEYGHRPRRDTCKAVEGQGARRRDDAASTPCLTTHAPALQAEHLYTRKRLPDCQQ